jgi:hemolysin III
MLFPATPARPLLRGYIHLVAAAVSPFALVLLLLIADSARAYVGGAIFGASLVLLFWTSASYHLLPWFPRLRAVIRRIDHAMIFLAVAGMYTPFCLQALGLAWGIPLLSVVGGLALFGAGLKLAWPDAPPKLNLACYLIVAWVGVIAAAEVFAALRLSGTILLLLSGLVFSMGGICFATRWPGPDARIFGHHELFHALVTIATGLLYYVVASDVLRL